MRATYSVHLISLDLIALIIFGEFSGRVPCCLHLQGEDGGNMDLWNLVPYHNSTWRHKS